MALLRSAFSASNISEATDIRRELSNLHTVMAAKIAQGGDSADEAYHIGDTLAALVTLISTVVGLNTAPGAADATYNLKLNPAFRDFEKKLGELTGYHSVLAWVSGTSMLSDAGLDVIGSQINDVLADLGWTQV